MHDFAGTTNDVSFTNTFTPAHQWATATVSNATFRWTPPAISAAYGPVNALNEYTTVGAAAYAYDTRGNQIGTAATHAYSCNPQNRFLGNAVAGSTYAYDPMGRNTRKVYATTTTNYLHDGDTTIAEYDGSGTLLRRYVPGTAIDDYVAMVTAAGVKTARPAIALSRAH